MQELEEAIFQLIGVGATEPSPLFVLGSPRTGSTFVYQALIASLNLSYFDNLTNQFCAQSPIVGLALRRGLPAADVGFESSYGKTKGLTSPSEASLIMTAWCGGGHPSELTSPGVLPDRRDHMRRTIAGAEMLTGKPLVIKNAWNCFRVRSLAQTFPRATFLWIRRDLEAAALSDLSARYVVQRDPNAWNSATPRNVEELRQRPPWEQVVHNQVEFARAIGDAAKSLPPDRFQITWYEDLCADVDGELARLCGALSNLRTTERRPIGGSVLKNADGPLGAPTAVVYQLKRYLVHEAAAFAHMRAQRR